MAVNNALRRDDDESKTTTTTTTTVLAGGVVESRGYGTRSKTREDVEREIRAFLSREGKVGFKSEARAFFTVWTFITRLPGPRWVDHHPGFLMRGMVYFPLMGSLVGCFVATWFDFAALGLPLDIAACVSTAASMWVTGCFHEDGLADASDGIGGGWSKTEILKIMSDTRLGTYGCSCLVLFFITKVSLLAALGTSRWAVGDCSGAGPALLVSHTVARWTAPFLIHTNEYIDEGGPKQKYYSFMIRASALVSSGRLCFATLFAALVVICTNGWDLWALLIGTSVVLFSIAAGSYARYLLGGVQGDYLGATICICEIVVLATMLLKTRANFEMNFLDLTVVRFLCLLLFVYVWTANIGHPDVFLQEKEKSPRKDEGDEITGERQANSSFVDMYQELMREIDSLAKPLGSLGTLEDWAARLGALQGTSRPKVKSPVCIVYAGDHGAAKSIADGGASCSAYPQEVTRYILKALRIGLAGASVLAGEVGVDVKVVDVGVVGECSDVSSPFKLKDGTRNFLLERAMTTEEVQKLLQVGRGAVKDCIALGHDCLALGEVGIGNTTASSLLLCTILSCPPEKCVDGGARKSKKVDEEKIKHKIALIKKALRKHARLLKSCPRGEDLLECFGGAEITALVGSFLEASDRKVPVLVDGFIVSIAALVAATISPCVTQCLFFGTKSAEKGHQLCVAAIQEVARTAKLPPPPEPALSMGLRLGEGTGAILAFPILRNACNMFKMVKLDALLGNKV